MINSPSIYFISISFIYSIFINILYFSKKHISTYETKIYGVMIIMNLVGLILEFTSIFVAYVLGINNTIVPYLFAKIFLAYLLLFAVLFTAYVLFVIVMDVKNKKLSQKENTIRKVLYLLYCVGLLLIFILPTHIYFNSPVMYSYGSSVNVVYIYSVIAIFICLVAIITSKSKPQKKKLIPLILFIVGMGLVTIIQKLHPGLTLATSVETFVLIIMYSTIENPDLKMIKELELAREQADKANRAKTDFLSSMSHEIRTPLNAIVGFSDCIGDAKTLEEAKSNAKDIVDASGTLLEIVNGILDISKIEAGKIEITESQYNARETFVELAKLITPKMNEKGLDFSYNIAPDIPEYLCGDHANIKKIITNLLSNASKYTDKGFVKYNVSCINKGEMCNLVISVKDSGRGIKKKNIDKLFKKFERLDTDRNTTIEGTGLGLAITKQLVDLMGGKIIVNSTYGSGSDFIVTIPQKIVTNPVVEEKSNNSNTLNLHNIRILIVDDNNLNLKVEKKLLEKYNANMITTSLSGFDCIDRIKRHEEYDVILLDDMMPKMSGVITLQKLKGLDGFNTPVIALTANAINGMREKYLRDGFSDYLSKPIEQNQLIHVLNDVLGNKVSKINTPNLIPVVDINMPGDNKNYLKENGVDIDHALSLLSDMDMYNSTIEEFVNSSDEKWSRIKKYKDSHDMPNYAIEVHSLKSDSKYLGFMKLADISYQHELKSKAGDVSYVDAHFKELEDQYNKVLDISKQYLKRI